MSQRALPEGVSAHWDDPRIQRAELRLPSDQSIILETRCTEHPVLGLCDRLTTRDGRHLAHVQSVNWAAPKWIPAVDRPGALPSGAGGALLNLLSFRAQISGISQLAYRGPYPTAALFDSLLECFSVTEAPAALARFLEGAEQPMLTGHSTTPAVVFTPKPHRRCWTAPGICVQIRDTIEKVFVHGKSYDRGTHSTRRLRTTGDETTAYVSLAGKAWADIVTLSPEGTLLEGPTPLPKIQSPWQHQPLAPALRAALVEALPPRAPAMLRPALRQVLEHTPMQWSLSGVDVAQHGPDGLELHVMLAERLATLPASRAFDYLALAIEGCALQRAQGLLAATWAEANPQS